MTVPARIGKILLTAFFLSAVLIGAGYQALKSQTNVFANVPATVDMSHYGKL